MIPRPVLRVLWWCVLAYAAGLLFGSVASAHDYAPGGATWTTAAVPGQQYPTATAAASAACAVNSWTLSHLIWHNNDGATWGAACDYGSPPNTVGGGSVIRDGTIDACEADHTYNENTGMCVGEVPPTCEASSDLTVWEGAKSDAEMMCLTGCRHRVAIRAGDGSPGGNYRYGGYRTAEVCLTGDMSPQPATGPCAAGTCQATVNSTEVCLPCGQPGTTPDGKTTVTTTNPDGTKTETTTTTTCTSLGCTTTSSTVTKDAGGAPIGNPSTTTGTAPAVEPGTDAVSQFCKVNPLSPICRVSSWGGACSTAFVCEGDAVQCAIAKEQHTRNCKFFDESNAHTLKGQEMLDGTDTEFQPRHVDNVEQVSVSSLNARPRLLSSTCPQDMVISLGSHEVTIPFSSYCTPMQWLGILAVALSMLLGARIALS